jgi:ADP-ribose pyrophosphatase
MSERDKIEGNNDEHLVERRQSSRDVYNGTLLKVRRDDILLPDGSAAEREYIVHPGAVAILPVLPNGNILLERQYRYPLERVLIELPAGKLDPGESELDCARRELLEETGYTARHWEFLVKMHPVVSYSTEFIDIYYAEGLDHIGANLDAGEFLETMEASPREVFDWIAQGRITDAKTLIGLLYMRERLLR